MIKLGTMVRDSVTGFEGIVTAKVEYLSGCTQYCVLPKCIDGKMPDGVYIDHQRLEVIDRGVALPSTDAGGNMRDAPSAIYKG